MSTRGLRVLSAVEGTIWAIDEAKLVAIAAVVTRRVMNGDKLSAAEVSAMTRPRATVRSNGSVAVLPLHGVIAQRMDMMTAMSGGTSTEAFAKEFDAAVRDDSVSAIIIDCSSPGGSVSGIQELAAKIRAARGTKPIVAIANDLMASAAYWICSAADEVVAAPLSFVGSVGTIMIRADMTAKDATDGVAYHFITGGANKGEGNPHKPFSEGERDAMQANVDVAYDAFVNGIAKNRGITAAKVEENFGQGRVLIADRALAAGMIERIATLDEEIARLSSGGRSSGSRARAEGHTEIASDIALSDMVVAAVTETLNTIQVSVAAGALNNDEMPAIPSPAPEARSVPMSDTPGTAAAVSGAADINAERERVSALYRLGNENEIEASTVDGWVKSGTSVDAASAQILQQIKAKRPGTDIVVGSQRETQKPWENFGAFAIAVHQANPNVGGTMDPRLFAAAQGMNQALPSEGGFAVPPSFSTKIWEGLQADPNALLPLTDQYTVEGESLTMLANAETSRATGSRWGGVRGYWLAEADQMTKSTPKLRAVKLEPHQLAVFAYVTEKLLNNSPIALEQFLTRAATGEIAFLTGLSVFGGSGAGQPKGFTIGDHVVQVTKETNQAAATVVQKNISKMWARLHPNARANAVWLHNVDVEPQLDNLSTTVTNVAGTENVGGYANKVFDAERRTLKGRPIIACEFCETLGTAGDIVLVDPTAYAAGVRGGIQSASSMHLRFDYAEMAFRFMFELDGQSWINAPLAPFKGTNTLSTVITLQTR